MSVIESDGTVKAVGVGSAVIKVNVGNTSASCNVQSISLLLYEKSLILYLMIEQIAGTSYRSSTLQELPNRFALVDDLVLSN
ncbi:MAG: hypothetical protein HDR01_03115 [Lachnospiraceae bacterium]|nr:hypothetical protein [Lachnospiraceae bacterium]